MSKFLSLGNGRGAVLTTAISAILRHTSEENATTLVLNSGTYVIADRAFEDVLEEVETSLTLKPLAEYVPELTDAFGLLQRQMGHEFMPVAGAPKDTYTSESKESPGEPGSA